MVVVPGARPRSRGGLVSALLSSLAVAFCVFASSAGAWTASVSTQSLAVVGDSSAANQLTVEDDGLGGLRVVEEAGRDYTGAVPIGCSTPTADVLTCSPGTVVSVSLAGGTLADTLTSASSVGGVVLDGAGGNDTLYAGAHGDRLVGGSGDDQLFGGAGHDGVAGGDGTDQLFGGQGSDQLDGGDGEDRLFGGSGSDVLNGEGGTDLLSGADGNDALSGGDGGDTLIGGDGDDQLAGDTGSDLLTGENGNDTVSGGDGDDQLSGDAGNDTLIGDAGLDQLDGGTGNDGLDGGVDGDLLDGGAGTDALDGSDGDDRLLGGFDNDRLNGGAGNDVFDGGEGADLIGGGDGVDRAGYADRTEPLVVTLDGAANDGVAGEGDNVGVDVEAVDGGSGPDVLTAGPLGTVLHGGAGNDVLAGLSGADELQGGPGDDVLRGGTGADVIAGGDGVDTVTYSERTTAVRVTLGSDAATSGHAREKDSIDGVEAVVGGSGRDTLTTLLGAPARLIGGPGADILRTRGSRASDVVRCGAGNDRAELDRTDQVSGDCERVLRDGRQVRPSVPEIFVNNRAARVRPDGVAVLLLTCSARALGACTGTAQATFRVAGKRGAARSSIRLVPRARGAVQLRLSPRSLRLLKRAGRPVKARVLISVKDGRGARAKRTVTLVLRAPR